MKQTGGLVSGGYFRGQRGLSNHIKTIFRNVVGFVKRGHNGRRCHHHITIGFRHKRGHDPTTNMAAANADAEATGGRRRRHSLSNSVQGQRLHNCHLAIVGLRIATFVSGLGSEIHLRKNVIC